MDALSCIKCDSLLWCHGVTFDKCRISVLHLTIPNNLTEFLTNLKQCVRLLVDPIDKNAEVQLMKKFLFKYYCVASMRCVFFLIVGN